MFGKRKSTTSKSINTRYRCPHCEAEIKAVQEEAFLRIFFVDLFRLTNWEYLECTSCEKIVYKDELVKLPAKEVKERTFEDGSKEIVTITRGEGGTHTKTMNDYSGQIPQVQNPLLLAQTLFSVMATTEKLDPSIRLEAFAGYKELRRHFNQYNSQLNEIVELIRDGSTEEAEKITYTRFEKARTNFGDKALNFILRKSLLLTRNHLVLPADLDRFYKDLLLKMGITELRLDTYLMDLRY